MIFDSAQVERTYCEYCNTLKPVYVTQMHETTADLIKVIAGSFGTNYFEDLCQEGHLKLQQIINKKQYRAGTNCSMYTFLDRALRNHMIDWLRKTQEHLELHESVAVYSIGDIPVPDEYFELYYAQRFPSLNGSGLSIASYVRESFLESVRKSKALNTIECIYSLIRLQAIVVYNSVEIFLRALAIISPDQLDIDNPLQHATNGHEFTLYPESVLVDCQSDSYKKLIEHIGRLRFEQTA